MTSRWECPYCGVYVGLQAGHDLVAEHEMFCDKAPPLHVRVALALAWRDPAESFPQNVALASESGNLPPVQSEPIWEAIPPWAVDPSGPHDCPYKEDGDSCDCDPPRRERIPLYHKDWKAIGPIIIRNALLIRHRGEHGGWAAEAPIKVINDWEHIQTITTGADPLYAVCYMVLRLSRDGRLRT